MKTILIFIAMTNIYSVLVCTRCFAKYFIEIF